MRESMGLDKIEAHHINSVKYFPKLRYHVCNILFMNETEHCGTTTKKVNGKLLLNREFENNKLEKQKGDGSGGGSTNIPINLNEDLIGKLDLVDNKDFIVALYLVNSGQFAAFSLDPIDPTDPTDIYSDCNCVYYPDELGFKLGITGR